MNKVSLIGRMTKDIELRYTSSQMAVAKFILAVKRRKKDSNDADFIPCTALGKNAENMEKFVKKGHKVAVVGRLQTGSYKKDGVTHYTTDVIVDEVEFLETKKQDAPEDEFLETKKQDAPEDEFQAINEDLPF